MPEGPSILILKQAVQDFKGKTVSEASGTVKTLKPSSLDGKKITDFKSWGKHFLICFGKDTLRIHFMLFGSYRINETGKAKPKLSLHFTDGTELNFYACLLNMLEKDPDEIYDWSADIMSDSWSSAKAKKKLAEAPERLVCDALLDQQIFSGCGNIIKNEVLHRTKIQPESEVGAIPKKKIAELIRETVSYSFDFLEWKKAGVLKKHWQAYLNKSCKRDGHPITKKRYG